ncbi:hypothetical protein A152_0019355 [Vibrio tasmaniensis 1F-187]|uniref:hypothetical protein n=1 Tax=unclassified Vibrio TaxID=2614977 RepID=UPI00030C752A|nr:hypothetical protein [Vibrio tasmaniensis]
MPEWFIDATRGKELSPAELREVTNEVVRTANNCSEEAKSLTPTEDDRQRRYSM